MKDANKFAICFFFLTPDVFRYPPGQEDIRTDKIIKW